MALGWTPEKEAYIRANLERLSKQMMKADEISFHLGEDNKQELLPHFQEIVVSMWPQASLSYDDETGVLDVTNLR